MYKEVTDKVLSPLKKGLNKPIHLGKLSKVVQVGRLGAVSIS